MNKKFVQEFTVTGSEAKRRLDVFVVEKFVITRSAAQKLAESSQVMINGVFQKSNFKLKAGDKVALLSSAREESALDVPIIYEDKAVIVIDKPPGITVHPAPGEKELTLSEILPQPIFVVHRLDKGTSGVMVFARNEEAAAHLKKQFHDRLVKKVYKALVSGIIKENSGSIDISLGRSLTARGKIIPTEDGRGAVTNFKVITRYYDSTLVEAMPKTGRTHQIRTHFAAIGHPLLGDVRYGGPGTGRVFLHAFSLAFVNPITGKKQEFISPLPSQLSDILRDLDVDK